MPIVLNSHRVAALLPLAIRLCRFLAVGLIGLSTDTLVYMALFRNGVPVALARGLSLGVATLVTWQLNRRFTFDPSRRHALQEAVRYTSVALIAQGMNYGLFLIIVAAVPGLFHPIAILISSACATVFSFTGQYLFTFVPATPARPRQNAGGIVRIIRTSSPGRAILPVARRLCRFLAVGSIGLSTDALIYMAFYEMGAVPALARAISLGVATLTTWRLNRRFTFDPSRRHAVDEGLRYTLVAMIAQGIDYGLFLTIVGIVPGIFHPLAILISASCAALFSFSGQSLFTFAPSGATRPSQKSAA
jgi:putative flippase GtrA